MFDSSCNPKPTARSETSLKPFWNKLLFCPNSKQVPRNWQTLHLLELNHENKLSTVPHRGSSSPRRMGSASDTQISTEGCCSISYTFKCETSFPLVPYHFTFHAVMECYIMLYMLCHGKNSKDGVHSLSEPLRVIEVVGVALLFAEVLKAEPWAKKLGPGANCLWKCWWAASSVRALWFIAFEISGVGYINTYIYIMIYTSVNTCLFIHWDFFRSLFRPFQGYGSLHDFSKSKIICFLLAWANNPQKHTHLSHLCMQGFPESTHHLICIEWTAPYCPWHTVVLSHARCHSLSAPHLVWAVCPAPTSPDLRRHWPRVAGLEGRNCRVCYSLHAHSVGN